MIDRLGALTVLAKNNGGGGWAFLAVLGVIIGLFVIGGAIGAMFGIPKKMESRRRERVKSCSRLYREIEALNNSKRSIKAKQFSYKREGYVFIRTYKDWQAYERTDYINNNRNAFELDLLHRQLFVDDCTVYQECVSKLWALYKADPKSIQESRLSSRRFIELEDELCKSLVLPIPMLPELQYDITVECGYQRRKKHFYLGQQEIESFLKNSIPTPEPAPIPAPKQVTGAPVKPKSAKEENVLSQASSEVLFTPNFVSFSNQANASSKPVQDTANPRKNTSVAEGTIPAALKPAESPAPSATGTSSRDNNEEARPTPAQEKALSIDGNVDSQESDAQSFLEPKPLAAAFNRYFNSIDNLEEDGLFWASLNDKEKAVIKYVSWVVFDLKADLIPTNNSDNFAFRQRFPESSFRSSLFWFKKGSQLFFMCRKKDDASDILSIAATYESFAMMRGHILSLINRERKKAKQRPHNAQIKDISSTATTSTEQAESKEAAHISQIQADFSETKTPTVQDNPKTQAEVNHESVLSEFSNLDLDNESLFYHKMPLASREIIDSVLLLATGMNRKIVAKNESGTFGFGRSDDPENGYSWFGFRQRLGESLTFFYKEERYSPNVATMVANKYQWNLISKTVQRIVNKDYGIPVRKPEPIKTPQASNDSVFHLENLNDPTRFYYNCTRDEKALIIRIANLSLSLNKEISFGNTKGYFGYKKKWTKDEDTQYWYWFRKLEGKNMSFAYRPSQELPQVINVENAINDKQAKKIESIVENLLLNKPNVQQKPAANLTTSLEDISKLATAIDDPSYFFKRLKPGEQQLVSSVIIYVKAHWPSISVENTKNFLGFRTVSLGSVNTFWFWFKKPEGYSMHFVYREIPTDPNKKTIFLRGTSADAIVKIIGTILPAEDGTNQANQASKKPSQIPDTGYEDAPKPPQEDGFWERPYLYTAEIMKKCGMKGAVPTNDIAAVCTLHHYTFRAGVAFNNKYRSLADAIYQSQIVNSDNKIYMYSNPYSSDAYDKALTKLQDELRIFDLGEGRYLTIKALEVDDGISYADAHKLKERIKKYLETHSFFSLDNLREACADCRFLEFATSDRIMMQFIHSVFGRGIKTIITDQDSPKSVFSTGLGEIEMHKFFVFITENADAMDIYTIKDRVETLFAINYSLDLIGKDAERAGFFYSEDLEKVYKNKKYFYKEIQQ